MFNTKQKLKVLNLYSGIGGNRKKWENVDVTAVEFDENIAAIYKDLYPDDTVIVGDAHKFLQEHYNEFDFIWSSPPCQSHSSMRQNISVRFRGTQPIYPDLKLYEEIIFLQYNFNGDWVVENVNPYYNPLIKESFRLDRHLFWSNKLVEDKEFEKAKLRSAQIRDLEVFLGFDLSNYKLKNKRQVLRNCVNPDTGLHIFNSIVNTN